MTNRIVRVGVFGFRTQPWALATKGWGWVGMGGGWCKDVRVRGVAWGDGESWRRVGAEVGVGASVEG